jgi:hypothetical protein
MRSKKKSKKSKKKVSKKVSKKSKKSRKKVSKKSTPTDKALYEKIKKKIFSKNLINSAYRSGTLVKEYKKEFICKHGDKKNPYKGNKGNKGLSRWFKEEWTNQRGKIGYKKNGDIYRPTKRIDKNTPKTFNQLSKAEINKAIRKKKTVGRVNRF